VTALPSPRAHCFAAECCEREHTLEEIGQEFDVTRERIRQIEAKALRQLRSPERARLRLTDRGTV